MAKAESRWDYVETGRGRIRFTHDNAQPPPSPPETQPVERVSESPEQSLAPNVQGQRRPFWRGVWPAIRRVPFWPTVKAVLIVCVCVVLIVITVNLAGFLVGTREGRSICTVIGLLFSLIVVLMARRRGFFP